MQHPFLKRSSENVSPSPDHLQAQEGHSRDFRSQPPHATDTGAARWLGDTRVPPRPANTGTGGRDHVPHPAFLKDV